MTFRRYSVKILEMLAKENMIQKMITEGTWIVIFVGSCALDYLETHVS